MNREEIERVVREAQAAGVLVDVVGAGVQVRARYARVPVKGEVVFAGGLRLYVVDVQQYDLTPASVNETKALVEVSRSRQ